MKKISAITIFMTMSFAVHAQGGYDPFADESLIREMLRSAVITILLWLVTSFIARVIRLMLQDRLKRKMVDRGTPADIIQQLLPAPKEEKNLAMKWFLLLTGIGLGLLAISLAQPLGIHSLALMVFCIALGYMAYYLFLRRNN